MIEEIVIDHGNILTKYRIIVSIKISNILSLEIENTRILCITSQTQ